MAWVNGYVVWVPFTPIDRDTPALELVNHRLPLWHRGNKATTEIEAVTQPHGKVYTVPDMDLGDVLIFDINCPHRTQFKGTRPRISIDLRYVKRVPYHYKGLVL